MKLEATALPTVPQPLPELNKNIYTCSLAVNFNRIHLTKGLLLLSNCRFFILSDLNPQYRGLVMTIEPSVTR